MVQRSGARGKTARDGFLDMGPWRHHWSADTWHAYLAAGEEQANLAAIRRCTYTGRPLGTAEFTKTEEPVQTDHRTEGLKRLRTVLPRKGRVLVAAEKTGFARF